LAKSTSSFSAFATAFNDLLFCLLTSCAVTKDLQEEKAEAITTKAKNNFEK